jgi:hypothetical protein
MLCVDVLWHSGHCTISCTQHVHSVQGREGGGYVFPAICCSALNGSGSPKLRATTAAHQAPHACSMHCMSPGVGEVQVPCTCTCCDRRGHVVEHHPAYNPALERQSAGHRLHVRGGIHVKGQGAHQHYSHALVHAAHLINTRKHLALFTPHGVSSLRLFAVGWTPSPHPSTPPSACWRSDCHALTMSYSEHLNTACSLPLVPPCKAMLADMCEALCFKGMHQTSSTEKSAASLTLQCPRLGIP